MPKQHKLLVTPEGRWVEAGSSEFYEVFPDPNPDYDAEDYAIRNFGFVRLQYPESIEYLEVKLHPRNVEIGALLAVEMMLLKVKTCQIFRIEFYDHEAWRTEHHSSAEDVVSRLAALCESKGSATILRYKSEPQDLSLVGDEHAMRMLLVLWRRKSRLFDETVLHFAIKNGLVDRLVVSRIEQGEAMLCHIGDGHRTWLNPSEMVGQSLKSLPDPKYGEWVSEVYRQVIESGQPFYDHVTARLNMRDADYMTCYERLVLPWKTVTNENLVTSLTYRLSPFGFRKIGDTILSSSAAA